MSLRTKLEYGLITVGVIGALTSGIKACSNYVSYQRSTPILSRVLDIEYEIRSLSPTLLTVNENTQKRNALETELESLSQNSELIQARIQAEEHGVAIFPWIFLGTLSMATSFFGGQLISWRKEKERELERHEHFKQRDESYKMKLRLPEPEDRPDFSIPYYKASDEE